MKKIYLGIPYTGMEEESYELATRITAMLMECGERNVFSPITHCHPLTKVEGVTMPGTWDFWEEIDHQFIDWADEVYFVVPGFNYEDPSIPSGEELIKNSTGVQAELDYARKKFKPITYVADSDLGEVFNYYNPCVILNKKN